MFEANVITSEDFNQISDIREILYQEKIEECEALKVELKFCRQSAEHWKNSYNSAMKSILDYCAR